MFERLMVVSYRIGLVRFIIQGGWKIHSERPRTAPRRTAQWQHPPSNPSSLPFISSQRISKDLYPQQTYVQIAQEPIDEATIAMSQSPSPSAAPNGPDSRRIIPPTAPYPPMSHRNPSTQLKSSLSSKPQYSSSAAGTPTTTSIDGGSILSESDSKSKSSLQCVAKFCQASLIAVINPASSTTTTTTTTTPLVSRSTTSRKLGPVLLEIQRLQWNPTSNSLYTLETVARSRGNPSLGTSVASTCLDIGSRGEVLSTGVMDGGGATTLPPMASGLSTGALCVHTFPADFDWSNNHVDDNGAITATSATTTTEYYHTGRHHRPATAVAWRPCNPHQVAISWASHASGSASGSSGAGGPHASKRGVAVGSQRSSQPHDRDFGCFIWDLQSHSTKVPLRRIGHQVGATDVGWIRNGDLLVRMCVIVAAACVLSKNGT